MQQKSTTILNYCNINSNHIDFICDTTPNKINTFTPGTHIPVVQLSILDNIPDYTFVVDLKKFLKRKKS